MKNKQMYMRSNIITIITLVIILIISITISSCTSEQEPTETSYRVIVQLKSDCNYSDLSFESKKEPVEAGSYIFVGTIATRKEILVLEQHSCVVRTMKLSELDKVLENIQNDLDSERDKEFQRTRIKRTIEDRDLTDKDDLREYLKQKQEEEQREMTTEMLSEYQLYVTPDADAVNELADNLDGIQEIYDEALSWVWVSEQYLNNQDEHWFTPEEFLTQTPTMPKNPKEGRPASDCSEQANTLASVLIADGISEENVRVVLGLVNFEGQRGGHAWVEIYENGRWIPLEATAGAYYDEETGILTGVRSLSYTYFVYHRYPSIEVWYYYNNLFFLDMTEATPKGNAPQHWQESSKSWLREDLERFESKDSSYS